MSSYIHQKFHSGASGGQTSDWGSVLLAPSPLDVHRTFVVCFRFKSDEMRVSNV